MCLNETYSTVWVRKYCSDTYPIRNGLKKGDALLPLLFNFTSDSAIRKAGKAGWLEIKWKTSAFVSW